MKQALKNWILLILMVVSAAVAWAMHPRISMADQRTKTDIASLIPTQFGDWQELKQSSRQIVNPQQTAELAELYSQTLSRTYINSSGSLIMLSVAYGKDQWRDTSNASSCTTRSPQRAHYLLGSHW